MREWVARGNHLSIIPTKSLCNKGKGSPLPDSVVGEPSGRFLNILMRWDSKSPAKSPFLARQFLED